MPTRTFVRSLRRPVTALLSAAVLCASVACMDSTANLPPSGRILFFNAAPSYTSTQLWVDSIAVLPAALPYAQAQYSSYIRASDTPRLLAVRNGSDTTTLASTSRAIHSDSLYIAIFTQHNTGGGLLVFPDTANVQQTGQTILRVTNLSPSVGPVDVYVTPKNADITSLTPDASNLAFEQGTSFMTYTATNDSLSVQITDAGTKTIRLNLPVNAPDGQVNDVFIIDNTGGGLPLKSFVLTKNSFYY